VYSDHQTGVIGAKPAVKMKSASATPGIVTAPPSVLQVPTSDDVPTGSAGGSADASMLRQDLPMPQKKRKKGKKSPPKKKICLDFVRRNERNEI
jgi:hypothetical protein